MADVRVLVNDIILYRNILADGSARKDDTVLYDSAFLHYAATANDGILHCSFNQAAIGDNGIFHRCRLEILGRTGIIGPCVDRPIFIKKACCCLCINQLCIRMIETLKVCYRSEVSVMRYAAHIQLVALKVDDLCQGIDGGELSCLGDRSQI